MALRIRPLTGTVGAEVEGIALDRPLASDDFAQLREAFLGSCMLVFRGQHLGPAAQVAFARLWGEPVVTAMLANRQLAEHPEIVQIAKIPKATSSTEAWHYIGHRDNVQSFEGMTREETLPLLEYLYAHCTQPDNTYRHMWRVGDVVMWDNRCTMHYAVHDYGEQERVLNRVTLKGEVPA